MKRYAKLITKQEDIDFLLNVKEDDITLSFIMDTFGEFDGKRKFNTYDEIDIPKDSYGPPGNRNKNVFRTTVGLWIFNKYFIEKDLFHIFKYINKTINKKEFGKINERLSYALLEDEIELSVMKKYLMKTQKVMPYVSILSPSYTLNMLLCTKEIEKKKKELFKKYEEEVKSGDPLIIDKIQSELLDFAKELLKDDPAMDTYNSGARGSFNNNFKNLFVMKGLVKDPDPNKGYEVATSSFMTGVKKEEYHIYAKSLAAGPYSRAKKTEFGGYLEKLFLAAYQHVVLDKEGSDCGTKRYITVDFNTENMQDYMYSYIIKGDNLVELTSKNMDKYKGKIVKLRFSSLCESKTGICNKCAGNLFYRLGIKNIGMTAPQIPSRLKVLSMKSFHNSSQTFVEMDPMKAFSIKR